SSRPFAGARARHRLHLSDSRHDTRILSAHSAAHLKAASAAMEKAAPAASRRRPAATHAGPRLRRLITAPGGIDKETGGGVGGGAGFGEPGSHTLSTRSSPDAQRSSPRVPSGRLRPSATGYGEGHTAGRKTRTRLGEGALPRV